MKNRILHFLFINILLKFIPKNYSNWLEGIFITALMGLFTIVALIDPEMLSQGDYLSTYLQSVKITIVVLSIISLFLGARFFRHYRLMEDIQTVKIRSCAQGYAELEGTQNILPENPITGKLSGYPRTWYSYKIEKHIVSDKHRYWKTIEQGASSSSFALTDNSGTCIIKPQGADIRGNDTVVWYGRSSTNVPPPSQSIISRIFPGRGKYRYTEYYMEPNTPLYAIGMFNTENKKHYLTNNHLPERSPFILSAIPKHKLIRNYKVKTVCYLTLFIALAASYPNFMSLYYSYQELIEYCQRELNSFLLLY